MKTGMFVIAVAVAMSGAVLASETQSYFDKQYNFAALKTFDIKEQRRISDDPLANNELWAKMIRNELTAQLQQRGYERSESNPNFLVGFYVGLKERYQVRYWDYGFPGPWGRWGYWRPWSPWSWWPEVDVWAVPYTDSTLIVDIIDAQTNMLVWRGYNIRTLDLDEPEHTFAKAVDRVLTRFLKDIGRRELTEE